MRERIATLTLISIKNVIVRMNARNVSVSGLPMKTCERCKKEFHERGVHQRFCSPMCRLMSWAEKQVPVGRDKKAYCVECGKPFFKYHSTHILCSPECRKIHNRLNSHSQYIKREQSKECAECGVAFVGSGRQKYCSHKCAGRKASRTYWYKLKTHTKGPKGFLRCPVCGDIVPYYSPDQETCSDETCITQWTSSKKGDLKQCKVCKVYFWTNKTSPSTCNNKECQVFWNKSRSLYKKVKNVSISQSHT
jgi:hypothetical protein